MATVSLALLVGCSFLVEAGEDRCATDEGCLAGEACIEGVCTAAGLCIVDDDCPAGSVCMGDACVIGVEICNNEDDDRDGIIDEEVERHPEVCDGVDNDCDHITDEDINVPPVACNMVDEDCDGDSDERLPEGCNNLDDDCDGLVDENVTCGSGEVCDARAGECRSATCDNDPRLGCGEDEFCDLSTNTPACRTRPADPCRTNDQCSSGSVCYTNLGICVETTDFGEACVFDGTCGEGTFCADLTMVGGTGSTCTATCCTDDDCQGPIAGVCSSTGTGVRLCVPTTTRTALGGACESNGNCASGYCDAERCQPQCSRDDDCSGDERCIFAREGTARGCRTPTGSRNAFRSCGFDRQCASGLCLPVSDPRGGPRCVDGCVGQDDCGVGESCFGVRYGRHGMDQQIFNFCLGLASPPEEPSGSMCSVDRTCESNYCHDGQCVAPCCSDSDCGPFDFCRPVPRGGQFPTYCVPG